MSISSGLLNQTLDLQTLFEKDDGMGGITYHWSLWYAGDNSTDSGGNTGWTFTSGSSFRGRISSLSAQEKMAQDKQTAMATHKIFCNPMNVSHKDRIKWGDYYFEIIGIQNPSELYHHLEIQVRELPN